MVWRSSRATSKRPFFRAIIALSKSSLSGCLEFTFASGLALRSWFFFFLGAFSLASADALVITRTASTPATNLLVNRFIPPHRSGDPSKGPPYPKTCLRIRLYLTRRRPGAPQPARNLHPAPRGRHQTPRYRPPEGLHLLGRPGRRYREPPRRLLRF